MWTNSVCREEGSDEDVMEPVCGVLAGSTVGGGPYNWYDNFLLMKTVLSENLLHCCKNILL